MNKGDIGIYLLTAADNVVYVGQSKTCLLTRVSWHRSQGVKQFDGVQYIPFDFDGIDDLEYELISQYKPKYNVAKGGMNFVKKQEDLPADKQRRELELMLRLNAYEKAIFQEAALLDQRKLRDWMRVTLVRAAERMIGHGC